ncbi:DUF6571 family protein [Actinomyces howellii]|uniref:DUF6571 domain-containing protein n=1 Tax=Actinomyces howellii TaxID=52771 RepID=A0A448HI42_9ACTO|nr:DUF6571 family protein [Actinomyces howellii]VEG29028.1 Uncharacterised protein [Actinomyces howellii]
MGKKVYLDPEALQRRVDAFKEIAEKAKDEVGKIVNASSDQADPMENPPLEEYTPKMRAAAAAVTKRLAEIEECKKTIERLSSNGIGTKVGDYGIEIEVPDDRIDSKGKLESWAKAAVDGKDLESLADSDGKDPLPSGRSYHELLKSLRENKGSKKNPHYANFLIDEVGPENLAKIPVAFQTHVGGGSAYGNEKAHEIASLLGQNLGIASTQWDRKRSKAVADGIVKSVTGKGKWGRIPALNAILGMHDKKYNYRTAPTFGKNFLLSLGEGLEKLPLDEIMRAFKADENLTGPQHVWEPGRRNNAGPFLAASTTSHGPNSMDPMAGVLYAMSKNPEVAHEYLAPDGSRHPNGSWSPGDKMKRRWELLTTRPREQNGGLDAFTAAQAAASSLRKNENKDKASSATWLSARSIEYAVDVVEEKEYSDEMKRNLAVVAANCATEGVNVARGGSPDGLGLEGDPSRDPSTFSTFLYRIMDNKDAATIVSAAFAREVRDRFPNANDQRTFKDKYQAMGNVHGYLNALGDKKVADMYGDDEKQRSEFKKNVTWGLGVGSAAIGGAFTGPVAPALWAVGSAAATPAIVDNAVPDATVPDDPITDVRSTLQAEAYGEAIARGLFKNPDALHPNLFRDEDGAYPWYSMENGKPVIDFSGSRGDAQNTQIHDWAIKVKDGKLDPDDVISNADKAIDAGIKQGEALINGESDKDTGSITIRR